MSEQVGQLVVAISSRALFDFKAENEVFDREGEAAYREFQLARLDQPADPGVAFQLVRKLLSFNAEGHSAVEVVVLSRNDPVSGLRVFRSAQYHNLGISRGVFVKGAKPYPYLHPLKANLFLSANREDVRLAIDAGIPAAAVFEKPANEDRYPGQLRIAFDGDSVLFDDEAERVFRTGQLPAFYAHESDKALQPLQPGPIQPFLMALHRLQNSDRAAHGMSVRTALVTARDCPAHERALRTLMKWNVEVDEAFFLGGLPKTEFLRAFEPDFFFDDQMRHVEGVAPHIGSGHVPFGVANESAVDGGTGAAGEPPAPGEA